MSYVLLYNLYMAFSNDKEESSEPDYDEDKDQQEESAELTSAVTTNQIF
jgi:hypothetical protein